jgi:hypothetical protein
VDQILHLFPPALSPLTLGIICLMGRSMKSKRNVRPDLSWFIIWCLIILDLLFTKWAVGHWDIPSFKEKSTEKKPILLAWISDIFYMEIGSLIMVEHQWGGYTDKINPWKHFHKMILNITYYVFSSHLISLLMDEIRLSPSTSDSQFSKQKKKKNPN